jgi:hypothetical protein
MDRSIPLFMIGLIFGGGIGFVVAAGNGVTFDGHDHADPNQHGAMASHGSHGAHDELLAIDAADAPTLSVMAHKDPAAGYNLHILTGNFDFSPEHASGDHVAGEGHAHVYVDGVKLGRFYGPWVHVAAEPGQTVKVTLNANDHRHLAVDDTPVEQTLILE